MASAQAIATATHSGLGDEPIYAFGRERRMHARAYDYWVSLLRGRRMPRRSDLEFDRLAPFADRSIMVDLPQDGGAPVIAHLGRGLCEEAEITAEHPTVADVPEGSLISEVLRRFSDITAYQAPVGLEAEIEDRRGGRLLHRGILLPFADEQGRLSAIFGVVSWKQIAVIEDAFDIVAALDDAMSTPPSANLICAWGDGPSASLTAAALPPQPLDQRLATARTWAALAESDRTRSDVSLHAALGAAYDYLLSARDETLTTRKSIRLIFGKHLGRLDRIRYAYTLDHAHRLGMGPGRVPAWLDGYAGGHVAIALAERKIRRAERMASADEAGQDDNIAAAPSGGIEFSLDQDISTLIGRRVPRGFEMSEAADDPRQSIMGQKRVGAR